MAPSRQVSVYLPGAQTWLITATVIPAPFLLLDLLLLLVGVLEAEGRLLLRRHQPRREPPLLRARLGHRPRALRGVAGLHCGRQAAQQLLVLHLKLTDARGEGEGRVALA